MKSASVLIRPAEPKDARDVNIMRRMPVVAENLLAVPSETISQNQDFIEQQVKSHDDHLFVAELIDGGVGRVVALAGLHGHKLMRQRHSAVIGILVHPEFHGQKIGSKLLQTLTDLADNWLLLKRIELTVYPDNAAAIKLYKNFGFVVEGTMKYAAVRRGKYEDILMMARYHSV